MTHFQEDQKTIRQLRLKIAALKAELRGRASNEDRLRTALQTLAVRAEKLNHKTTNDYDAGYLFATQQCSEFAKETLKNMT